MSWGVNGRLHSVRFRRNFKTREDAAAEQAALEGCSARLFRAEPKCGVNRPPHDHCAFVTPAGCRALRRGLWFCRSRFVLSFRSSSPPMQPLSSRVSGVLHASLFPFRAVSALLVTILALHAPLADAGPLPAAVRQSSGRCGGIVGEISRGIINHRVKRRLKKEPGQKGEKCLSDAARNSRELRSALPRGNPFRRSFRICPAFCVSHLCERQAQ